MKTHYPKILSFITCCILMLSACSDNKDVLSELESTPAYQNDYLMSLTRGETSACYKLKSTTLFEKRSEESDWEEINPSEMIGWATPAPVNLTISEGRTWIPMEWFDISIGPDPLFMPWLAYCRTIGSTKDIYIACPIVYDNESKELSMNDESYTVETFTESAIEIKHFSIFSYYSKTDSKIQYGEYQCNLRYEKSELSLPAKDNILFFDSEKEAKLAVIQMIREKFGDVFNLNDYLGNEIQLDNPIIDLREIEKTLL